MAAMKVRLGSERLLASGALKNKRVGIVSNPASVDANFQHIVRAIAVAPDVTLAAIFGPQHGYRADVQDNMIETGHAQDPTRGVPVYSLYSETREPTAEMLDGLDVLVIDLQDVGSRIYTFVYTMANCLRACRKHGVPVIVTDRPNPIGGEQIDGPMLAERLRVVRRPVSDPDASRHDDWGARAVLQRELRHRRRSHRRADGKLGAPDVLRRHSTAVGHAVAEHADGRSCSRLSGNGALRGNQRVGGARDNAAVRADWRAVGRRRSAGRYSSPPIICQACTFRPAVFEPTFQKHAKQACGGCQIHVLNRNEFRAVTTAVAVLVEMRAQNPERIPVAAAAVRIRADETAVRHPRRVERVAGTGGIRRAGRGHF